MRRAMGLLVLAATTMLPLTARAVGRTISATILPRGTVTVRTYSRPPRVNGGLGRYRLPRVPARVGGARPATGGTSRPVTIPPTGTVTVTTTPTPAPNGPGDLGRHTVPPVPTRPSR